jgi:hypothetical protein
MNTVTKNSVKQIFTANVLTLIYKLPGSVLAESKASAPRRRFTSKDRDRTNCQLQSPVGQPVLWLMEESLAHRHNSISVSFPRK